MPWPGCEPFHSRPDGTVGDRPTHRTTEDPRRLVPARSERVPCCVFSRLPRIAAPADGHRGPCAAMKTVRRPPYPKWNPGYFPCSSLTPLPLSSRRPSVSFGGFGLRLSARRHRVFLRRATMRFKTGLGTARGGGGAESVRRVSEHMEVSARLLIANMPLVKGLAAVTHGLQH